MRLLQKRPTLAAKALQVEDNQKAKDHFDWQWSL